MRHLIDGKQKTACGLWLGGPEFRGYVPETATLNTEKVTCGACRRSKPSAFQDTRATDTESDR